MRKAPVGKRRVLQRWDGGGLFSHPAVVWFAGPAGCCAVALHALGLRGVQGGRAAGGNAQLRTCNGTRRYCNQLGLINALEPAMMALTSEQLQAKTGARLEREGMIWRARHQALPPHMCVGLQPQAARPCCV